MALSEQTGRLGGLRLNTRSQKTENDHQRSDSSDSIAGSHTDLRRSKASEETLKPSSLKGLGIANEEALVEADPNAYYDDPAVEEYLQNRKPSISFDNNIKLDTGHSQSMHEPLQKPAKFRSRGRSVLQAISDERTKGARAHSESDREQYDPITGKHLPQYSNSPPQDEARFGEGRFPLLQSTVDAMARESQTDLPNAMSMTSESTMSPSSDEIRTPKDDKHDFILSPSAISPYQYASSYEEPKRRASQRWREGQASSDFFSRAGRKGGSTSNRVSRQDTNGSMRSTHSAASSFLRAFSAGSDFNDSKPLECDAEGQTVGDDYVLGKQIGFGGFSVIKEATHMDPSGTQRKLAVKIVRKTLPSKSDDENDAVQAEFEHEVELWRFLSHPRILPLEAVYKTEEATFCFIPLNTGGTLFDAVRTNRHGLLTHLCKRYTYHMASALRYLHSDARVVHRDVKLENCLLDTSSAGDGEVRLCDFGMAEWISSDSGSGPPSPNFNAADRPLQKNMGPADTSTSAFAGGSLEYAAPEILRVAEATQSSGSGSGRGTERAIVSAAVDVWAFGVCVYTMVVGSRPFSHPFQPRVVMAILAGDWDRDRLREKGGADVLKLVEGCLEMERRERWDIQDVLECAWLAEVVEREEEEEQRKEGAGNGNGNGNGGGWRL